MQIRPVRAELVHADRRIGMAELTVSFRNAANAPKMGQNILTNDNSRWSILQRIYVNYIFNNVFI